jgi:hypothetical protein
MLLGVEENRTVAAGAAVASFYPSVKLPRDRPAHPSVFVNQI